MRRGWAWLLLVGAVVVAIGVLLQAFSIAAYVRGAGDGALDMHGAVSLLVHLGELAIVIGAVGTWWGNWRGIGLAVSFLALSVLQVALLGDTEESGGWVNGLHGLLALVVLLAAAAYLHAATRALGLRGPPPTGPVSSG
jgi:hypothetical protein